MRLTIEPAMRAWRTGGSGSALRGGLASSRLATAVGVGGDQLVVATGHQAWHWHPGILAKYLAASALARRCGAVVLDVVVDQDVYDPLRLELPARDGGGRLGVETVELGASAAGVPPGMQEAVARAEVVDAIDAVGARLGGWLMGDLSRVREAWHGDQGDAKTLAGQVSGVLHRLMAKWTGGMATITATQLAGLPSSRGVIEAMLGDAANCVRHYNAAVGANPQAGLAALAVERERIELPLWWLRPGEGRRRVFADVADSRVVLVDEFGELIEWGGEGERARGGAIGTTGSPATNRALGSITAALAPRAMLLTALMRAFYCDFFVHGTGGGVYDRVTEAWWRGWRGEELAPMAVVTADVRMEFAGVPVADKSDLERAVWYAHHLPHNLDRHLPVDAVDRGLAERKRELLAGLKKDADERSRRQSFNEVHRINAELGKEHAGVLRLAEEQIDRMREGVRNAGIAGKRDWCFALYPEAAIDGLAREIERELG